MQTPPRKPAGDDPLGGIGSTAAFVAFATLVAIAFCVSVAPYVN